MLPGAITHNTVPGTVSSLTVATAGAVCYRDTSASLIKEATSSVGNVTNLYGVNFTPIASTDTRVDFTPIVQNATQLWVADCTNATNVDQLYKAQALTDSTHLANTSTAVATELGVFIPIGVASATELIGYFAMTSQVVSH